MSPIRVLVATHDWGGLNLLVPLLRTWVADPRFDPYLLAMPGVRGEVADLVPGIALADGSLELSSKLANNADELGRLLTRIADKNYSAVVCGTSLHSTLERRLCIAARSAKIPSVAFCDMPWALTERFRQGHEWALPDRLWVVDERTRNAALAIEWPQPLPIDIVGNPMLGEVARHHATSPSTRGRSIRFISEPASIEFPQASIDEFALAELLLAAARPAITSPIVIRPHPVEPQEAWRRWTYARRDAGVMMDTLPLGPAIADSSVAVGICSMLLIQMRLLGVPAASLQLPEADSAYFCLPFEEYGVTTIASRNELAKWLRSENEKPPVAIAPLHLSAVETATRLLFEMVSAPVSMPGYGDDG